MAGEFLTIYLFFFPLHASLHPPFLIPYPISCYTPTRRFVPRSRLAQRALGIDTSEVWSTSRQHCSGAVASPYSVFAHVPVSTAVGGGVSLGFYI
ncbi:hypothetical protein FB451DRAFT_731102 [Mycena latifolia]|nr:hypothetical protein FB451DRAFT_731102 [Mycena latifolia]